VDCSTAQAIYPNVNKIYWSEQLLPCGDILYDLAPCGVYPATLVAFGAVGAYPAFSPLPVLFYKPSAVFFLWHFPSACQPERKLAAFVLQSALLCGVRTFLISMWKRDCPFSPIDSFYMGNLRKNYE